MEGKKNAFSAPILGFMGSLQMGLEYLQAHEAMLGMICIKPNCTRKTHTPAGKAHICDFKYAFNVDLIIIYAYYLKPIN